LVQRWILAVLRNRTFFSLDELNQALAELLTRLNSKPFRKISGSRESLFAELDKPALVPQPTTHYEYAEWKPVRLGFNYHVQIDEHFYSAPYHNPHMTPMRRRYVKRYTSWNIVLRSS